MSNKSMKNIWSDKRKESERLSKIRSKSKQDNFQSNVKPQDKNENNLPENESVKA